MKTLIFPMVFMFTMTTPEAHALFGHVAQEKERRMETEQQLVQEQERNGLLIHSNQNLHVVISILSAGGTIALVVGAAIGSKARRDHANL